MQSVNGGVGGIAGASSQPVASVETCESTVALDDSSMLDQKAQSHLHLPTVYKYDIIEGQQESHLA